MSFVGHVGARRATGAPPILRRVAVGLVLVPMVFGLASISVSQAAFINGTDSTGNSFGTDVLAAPTGVTASGGAAVTIDWTATIDTYASGHRVLRSMSPGGPYTQVAEVTPRATVTYLDSPANGTYYYVLRAFDGNWESANSSEASAAVYEVGLAGSWQTGVAHTATAGGNRILVFTASNEESAASTPTLSSVTYGGQALTKVVSEQVTSSSVTALVETWILDEAGIAAASNTTFVPTWTATPNAPLYAHAIFENVDQATPTGGSTTASSPADTPNPVPMSALSTSDNDVVIVAATAGEIGTYAPQNGFTLGINEDNGSDTTALGTAYKLADGSSITASMLFNSSSPPEIKRQAVAAFVLNLAP